ncbi:MAG TPA: MATE family efflux transporter [Saprospirales bacterium]|nr:MATE family efflux transporter [Saprospirales bacterium]HRQ30697.1 MATE family efflux transporter [Saprospiraceae bacterium]
MKDLTVGKEHVQIFYFAVPMLFGNLFQQLYNVVDSVVVGKFLGDDALAAVGASFPIIFLLISLIIGFTIGGSITVSQFFGAKQYDKVRISVDTINVVILVASLVMGTLGIIFSDQIFMLIDLPEKVIPDASVYLRIYLLGLPFLFGFSNISALLRGVGDSKTPLYFLIFSTILNIILDLIFVAGLGYGIASVALATVISQALGLVLAAIWIRKNDMLRFRLRKIVFDKMIFNKSQRIGLPSGIQHVLFSLGMLALFGIVNKFGVKVIAGYSAAMRLDSLAIMPAMNLSGALSTFVGQNIGAGKFDRIGRGLRATLVMSTGISVSISIIIFFFGESLMKMFSSDPKVIRYGVEYLVIVSSFYFVFSALFSVNAVMRGAGDMIVPMIITLISLWLVRIPFANFFMETMGEKAVWWSAPAGWMVGLILSFLYYNNGRWKRKFRLES